MIKICERCGNEFDESHFAKYCPNCRSSIKVESKIIRNRVYEAEGKPVKSLDDWAREAYECNLDYGTYRALIAAGRTFDELKAQADAHHPPTHSHCQQPFGF